MSKTKILSNSQGGLNSVEYGSYLTNIYTLCLIQRLNKLSLLLGSRKSKLWDIMQNVQIYFRDNLS